jgi:hypothetical protein
MTKQESAKALKNIIKLTTRARDINREISTTKNKLAKLQKEEAEIYEKLAVFSSDKPDTTDTLEDEPTESYSPSVSHTLAV